jgi:inorganic pyrophosphatase
MESTDEMVHKTEYSIRRSGRPFTKDYRIFFERAHDKVPVSPFHDIPLYHDKEKGILNMVVEVPRWTNAKFEVRRQVAYPTPAENKNVATKPTLSQISRDESLNPIHQDTLDHNPRFVKNFFPYKGYLWNYGALPQVRVLQCYFLRFSLHPHPERRK